MDTYAKVPAKHDVIANEERSKVASTARSLPAVPVLRKVDPTKGQQDMTMPVQKMDASDDGPPVRERFVAQNTPALTTVQRAVHKSGGKGSVAVPQEAKTIAGIVVSKTSIRPGGSAHIADVQGRGFAGYTFRKGQYVGGRTFDNTAANDSSRLPYSAGQTYQEWDIRPAVVNVGRGGERIVTSSDGSKYYTNNHYQDFTEF